MNKELNKIISNKILTILSNSDVIFLFDALLEKNYTYSKFINQVFYYKDLINSCFKDKKIVLLFDNSAELVFLYFACLFNKNVIIPIDPQKNTNEIAEILDESDCKQVIIDNEDKIKNIKNEISSLNISSNSNDNRQYSLDEITEIIEEIDFSEIYSINFTSGTTGVPKGVMHSFQNFYLSAIAFSEVYEFSEKTIFYHNLPMTYMAGMLNLIFVPFLSGSKIVIGRRFSIATALNFWEIPIKYDVNAFFFIPAIIALLNKLDRGENGVNYTAKHQITACIGTAPLNQIQQQQFEEKYKVSLLESYGLSETLFVSANSPKNNKIEGVGKLLRNVDIQFGDDSEICIDVLWMFKGYYNLNTNGCFVDDKYFVSGDLGNITDKGYLKINDRKKDIIIKGGTNLGPKKIELIISDLFAEDYLIIGIKDNELGEKICCAYLGNELSDSLKKQINQRIIQNLGAINQIDVFCRFNDFPKNFNGKIDKKELLNQIQNDY